MKFNDLLDSVYMETRFSIEKESTAYRRAKASSIKNLNQFQQSLLKIVAYFDVLGHYALIKLHLTKPPKSAQEMFNEANKQLLTKEQEIKKE